jgi:hypothetical protein
MRWKAITLETAAVVVCYLVMTMPVTSATTVNIYFNGQVMDSVEYEPSSLVTQGLRVVHDPPDITWSNVRISMTLTSASLAHTVKRVYLYKCGALSPVGCMQKTPEVFDNYVDTEIAWSDIGQSTGPSTFPQEGNLLFMVKLEDPEGLVSWISLWKTIRRTSARGFLFLEPGEPEMDVHAGSSNMVDPIMSYIRNFNVIPFRWLTKAVFSGADSISAIGGDDTDLDSSPPGVQTAEPSSNDITVINRENYFVFPEVAGEIALPITLEQNPDFQCGDGYCESNLGEDQQTCCYDCGCDAGYYCDAPQGSPELGTCKDSSLIDLAVVGTPSAQVSDCSQPFDVGITARISNAPASMSDTVTGTANVNGTLRTLQCTLNIPGEYICIFSMSPTIECSAGPSALLTNNEIQLTASYNDGPNTVTRDLTSGIFNIDIDYDCYCEDEYYCDSGTYTCEREDSVTLSITELSDYLDPFDNGITTINLTAKINNPPTGTGLEDTSVNFTLSQGEIFQGTASCTSQGEDPRDGGYIYDCRIQFSIDPYFEDRSYRLFPNNLEFNIHHNDGTETVTRTLSKQFGPISIPSQNCGNGVPNPGETADNCCQDVGCHAVYGDDYYCDVVRGCMYMDDITLTATATPASLEDCKIAHEVDVQANVNNAPYGLSLDSYAITVNYQPVPWRFECPEDSVGGIYYCKLVIPPLDECGTTQYTIGPNNITFTISFPEGREDSGYTRTMDLNASLNDIYVTPVPHIDGVCEIELGESSDTACLDCPCGDNATLTALGDYYCDTGANPKGTCLPEDNIRLAIDSPQAPVHFDSCEQTNKVYVVMHVDNEPAGMRAQNVYAVVNGSAASYASCREISDEFVEANTTFNCTVRIPPVPTCRRNTTYRYTNNNISLVISYDNGDRGRLLRSLSAYLPDFSSSQSTESIYEIMDRAKNDMEVVLNNIMDLTEKMADNLYRCINLQLWIIAINLIGTFVFGFIGMGTTDDSKWKGFSEGAMTWATAGQHLATGVEKLCNMYQKYYEIMIEIEELHLERIGMDTCLRIAQHDLDIGRCMGHEQECFNQMLGCLDRLDDMRSIRNEISTDASSMNADAAAVSGSIADAAEAFAEGPWSEPPAAREFYFTVTMGRTLSDGALVCKEDGLKTTGLLSECRETKDTVGSDATITIDMPRRMCRRDYLLLVLTPKNGAPERLYELDLRSDEFAGGDDIKKPITLESFLTAKLTDNKEHTLQLYCSKENTIIGSIDTSKHKAIGAAFRIMVGERLGPGGTDNGKYKCHCRYDGKIFRNINPTSNPIYIPSGEVGQQPAAAACSECQWEGGKDYKLSYDTYLTKKDGTRLCSLRRSDIVKTLDSSQCESDPCTINNVQNYDWWRVSVVSSDGTCGITNIGYIKAGLCYRECYLTLHEPIDSTPAWAEYKDYEVDAAELEMRSSSSGGRVVCKFKQGDALRTTGINPVYRQTDLTYGHITDWWHVVGMSGDCETKQGWIPAIRKDGGNIIPAVSNPTAATPAPPNPGPFYSGCPTLATSKRYKITWPQGLSLREGSNIDANVKCASPQNTLFEALDAFYTKNDGEQRDWLRVRMLSGNCQDQTGWISAGKTVGTSRECNFEESSTTASLKKN